jgi:hypothetical protein
MLGGIQKQLKTNKMATTRQVKCINKTDRYNRHERIKNLGGDWGKVSESDAISQIENKTNSYYVMAGGYTANVIIEVHEGRKYLKTDRDSVITDNLLSLPECS